MCFKMCFKMCWQKQDICLNLVSYFYQTYSFRAIFNCCRSVKIRKVPALRWCTGRILTAPVFQPAWGLPLHRRSRKKSCHLPGKCTGGLHCKSGKRFLFLSVLFRCINAGRGVCQTGAVSFCPVDKGFLFGNIFCIFLWSKEKDAPKACNKQY